MPNTIKELINPSIFKGDYWEKAGKDLLAILEASAVKFVEDNADLAIGLTEDEVKGILFNAMLDTPALPELPEGASPAQLATVARIAKARAAAFALTMEAQKLRNFSTAKLEENAKEFAVAVGKTVLGAVLGSITGGIVK